MNSFRKAISAGLTATLLASLLTVVAASSALAAVTVGSAGNVPRGGTSTGTVTLTFTESAAGCLLPTLGTSPDMLVTIPAGLGVTFSGTPVVSAPGSLGATASAASNILTINLTGSDVLNVETITITGLTLTATTTATIGDVTATVSAGDAAVVTCFTSGPQTATGLVAVGVGTGSTNLVVNVDNCLFEVTDVSDLQPGNLVFGTGGTAETRRIDAVSLLGVPGPGQQTLTIQATTTAHPVDQIVSQAGVLGCSTVLLTGLGTVRDSLVYNAPASVALLFPGENNQPAPALTATERTLGFLSVGTTVTFTITTAGVVFSSAPPNLPTLVGTGGIVFGALTLSADHTSATATVTTASAAASTITLGNIHYDVASTVASGTFVNVTLALSGGKVVVPTSRANAQVGRIFTATAATLPNVNIGQNNQATGLISIVEVAAGAFTDGSGSNNTFEICPDATSSFSSPGPWAKVTTTDVGALRLREGSVASPDNIVAGTADPDPTAVGCYYWTVWTKSTVASTIQIGNATFTSGPLVNVNFGSSAGPLNANLSAGTIGSTVPLVARSMTLQVSLQIANRVFASQVKVTALSQPVIAVGSTNTLAGDIEIAETGNGQLKLNERICVEVVPNQNTGTLTDAYLSGTTTANLPVATASGGTLIGPITTSTTGCNTIGSPSGTIIRSFSFVIAQQSTTGAGKVVISNIRYNVLNDAVSGPVQVNVWGISPGGANIDFQSVVSNARIGTSSISGSNATRLGVTQTGAFTISTKVAKVGKYVTYRFDFGVAAAGQILVITGATKTGNDWSAFTTVTSRRANASGVVYYYIRHYSATWKSYRASWAAGGVITLARQSRWIP